MQRSTPTTTLRTVLLLLCVVIIFGCGRREYPILYIYCNETFWYVLQEEALVFNRVYGFRVVLIPIRAPQTSDETEKNIEINGAPHTPVLWESTPDEQTTLQADFLHTQIHPEITRQIESIAEGKFGDTFLSGNFGDMFLSDSQKQVAKLQETALSAGDFPVCYLTLTMLVPTGNPHQFRSVKDVLDGNRRLGIVDPALDGLGESSWEVLGRIVPDGESTMPMKLVQLYKRQYDLLEALEQKKIDAALVWDATSQKNFLLIKYAEKYNVDPRFENDLRKAERQRNPQILRNVFNEISVILIEEKSFAEAVPLTENPDERQVVTVRLVVLSSTSNFGYSKRFTDFMRSNQGKAILRRFGFVAE